MYSNYHSSLYASLVVGLLISSSHNSYIHSFNYDADHEPHACLTPGLLTSFRKAKSPKPLRELRLAPQSAVVACPPSDSPTPFAVPPPHPSPLRPPRERARRGEAGWLELVQFSTQRDRCAASRRVAAAREYLGHGRSRAATSRVSVAVLAVA